MDAAEAKRALAETRGIVVDAARILNVSRATLDRWISRTGLRATLRLTYPRRGSGGCPPGTRTTTRRLRRRPPASADGLLRIERECEVDGEYISIADASGTMVTIRLYARTEAGRLADFIQNTRRNGADVSARGHSEQTDVAAEIQVSSASERAKAKRIENAIVRICGPAVAARIQEEAAKP